MVVQRPGAQDVVCDVLPRLLSAVAVLAVADLAVVIDHLEERNHGRAQLLGLEVVVVPPAYADQSFEEVAVGQRPLAPALAAEEAEHISRVVAQADFPRDIVVASDRMVRVEAFPRPDGVRRVDEVAPGRKKLANRRQVLGPLGQLQLLRRTDHVGPAAQPAPAGDQGAVAVLLDESRVPALGVPVHVLHVVVQTGDVIQCLHAPDRIGQRLVAATLGVGRKVVGVPAVVAALGPAAHHEEATVELHVVVQVFGNPGRLVKRPADLDRLLSGAVLVHPARQTGPQLGVRCADHSFEVLVPLDLLAQRCREPPLAGVLPVRSRDVVPIAASQGHQPQDLGAAPHLERRRQLAALGLPFRDRTLQFGKHVGIVPRHDQRRASLDQAQHVHVAALVVRGAEGLLENPVSIGRHQQALPARDDHVAVVVARDRQGIVKYANRRVVRALVANLQRLATVHQCECDRPAAFLDQPHRILTAAFGPGEIPFEPGGSARTRHALRRPRHAGTFVRQPPLACCIVDLHAQGGTP